MNRKAIVRGFQIACLAAGVCLIAYPVLIHFYGKLYQCYLSSGFPPEAPRVSESQHRLPLAEGMPVAKLEIPRLDVSVVVLEGVSDSVLKLAPGHIPDTTLPGRSGNVGIAAHRDTFFRPLKDIRNGDVIRVSTYDGVFDYRVEWTRIVKPEAIDVLDPTEAPSLTLVTCYPFYYIGSAPDRFIVRARQVSNGATEAST